MTQLRGRTRRHPAASRQTDLVALEGTVDDISLRGGLHFYVREQLTGRRVHVSAPLERMNEVIATLGRRVSLTGSGTVSQDGGVRSSDLDRLDVLPRDEDLPSLDELLEQAAAFDMTGGVPADAWLRRLRGRDDD